MVFSRKDWHLLIDYVTMLVYGYVYVFSFFFCNLQNLGQMMQLDVETYFSDDSRPDDNPLESLPKKVIFTG